MSVAGIKLDVGSEAKPLIDQTVNQQVAALENRLRNDPFLERTAREQWNKMCRSMPLGGGKTGLPELWLEMRPIRAAAAQPQIDARDMTLTIGVQAETRIVPAATKPACPFPDKLELVPPMDNGKLAVGVPIDLPFTELNKLLEAQFKGKTFPEDGSGPVSVEVLSGSLGASGDRMLISLLVKARERKSWFGFGAQATIQIWGKPVLDTQTQILRLTDLVAGGGIGSGLRPARRRRARRRALSAAGAGREGGARSQAVRRRRQDQDRRRARRFPEGRRPGRAGRHQDRHAAPDRHRVRIRRRCA